jgi:oxygen-independent coproporphyrinogen-3 oxidase
MFTTSPPLSLYIHFPWCVRKCPYCDFNSYPHPDQRLPEHEYIAALLADLEQDLPQVSGRPVISIFMGGGTPSLFSPEALNHLLTGLRARLPIQAEAEITLEANPGTVESTRFQEYREVGINRLSLGIQSFDEAALQRLGRIHNRLEALLAIDNAKQAGFDNLNIDLMFGLPAQTWSEALADLQMAIAASPSHLSWYQLTIEPNTSFSKNPPALLPDDEVLWEMQLAGQSLLAEHHMLQYEVSAYAKEGRRCQHNLNYWKFGDYLGIGAGAHAKITNVNQGTISRFSKQRLPDRYLKFATSAKVIESCTTLTKEEVILEFMMNALRLCEGFTIQEFSENTGLPMEYLDISLQPGFSQDWLVRHGDRIQTTARGMQFLDELLRRIVV